MSDTLQGITHLFHGKGFFPEGKKPYLFPIPHEINNINYENKLRLKNWFMKGYKSKIYILYKGRIEDEGQD